MIFSLLIQFGALVFTPLLSDPIMLHPHTRESHTNSLDLCWQQLYSINLLVIGTVQGETCFSSSALLAHWCWLCPTGSHWAIRPGTQCTVITHSQILVKTLTHSHLRNSFQTGSQSAPIQSYLAWDRLSSPSSSRVSRSRKRYFSAKVANDGTAVRHNKQLTT